MLSANLNILRFLNSKQAFLLFFSCVWLDKTEIEHVFLVTFYPYINAFYCVSCFISDGMLLLYIILWSKSLTSTLLCCPLSLFCPDIIHGCDSVSLFYM